MKTWLDLASVRMPTRIAAMQRDDRGYPIPHTVFWRDGVPDFRVIDPHKWAHAAQFRRCGICGQSMGAFVAFVGGERSITGRMFTDLGMHRECAEYSLQVCPMLAAPKFSYARAQGDDTTTMTTVSDVRPDRFGLGVAKGYSVMRLGDDLVLHARPFVEIQWWRHGSRLE